MTSEKSPSVGHSETSAAAFPEARSALPAADGIAYRLLAEALSRLRNPDLQHAVDLQLANTTHPSLHGTQTVPSINLLFLFFLILK